MVVIEAKLKKWGNSFGVVIPIEVISSEHMKENENIRLILLKDSKKAFEATFGIGKGKLKKTGQEFKDDIRRDLYSI